MLSQGTSNDCIQDESKPDIKKESENTDDKAMARQTANRILKKGFPSSSEGRMEKEEKGPSLPHIAVKQEFKNEIKTDSAPSNPEQSAAVKVNGLEEEMQVDRLPPAHDHAEPAKSSNRTSRRKRKPKGHVRSVDKVFQSSRGIKVKREASPDVLPAQDVEDPKVDDAIMVRQESRTTKIVKKVKPENLCFDLNVLWSSVGGSSQHNFLPIYKTIFKHGLGAFMYPGPKSQLATPEVPGVPGLWLDLEDTTGSNRHGDTPRRVGTAKGRGAKCMGECYSDLRERLLAKQFLGREPEEYEVEQLRAGNMSTNMSEAEIQLCMASGDLVMTKIFNVKLRTSDCGRTGFDHQLQRKGTQQPSPPQQKERRGRQEVIERVKEKAGGVTQKKSKTYLTLRVRVRIPKMAAHIAYATSGTRSHPQPV
ncbi:hypothetical protein BKA70DRAFT_1410964 [Coprinopsis sp. MPI-PUGE-AT-0042]|nr:hypothetical protein BKA70DRAFT_1410964 [Coprinopsis sp. MPI-PUGE-AT-0042]